GAPCGRPGPRAIGRAEKDAGVAPDDRENGIAFFSTSREEGTHLPFFILHLSFVIARVDLLQWQMTNVIWKMVNESLSPPHGPSIISVQVSSACPAPSTCLSV